MKGDPARSCLTCDRPVIKGNFCSRCGMYLRLYYGRREYKRMLYGEAKAL